MLPTRLAGGIFPPGGDFNKGTPALTEASISLDGQQDQDIKLACTIPVRGHPRYKMCFATRDANSPMEMGRADDPEAWHEMQSRVMSWVLANFGEASMYVARISGLSRA
jgi:hypothetical protein